MCWSRHDLPATTESNMIPQSQTAFLLTPNTANHGPCLRAAWQSLTPVCAERYTAAQGLEAEEARLPALLAAGADFQAMVSADDALRAGQLAAKLLFLRTRDSLLATGDTLLKVDSPSYEPAAWTTAYPHIQRLAIMFRVPQ